MNEPRRHCQLVCIFLLRSFRWFKEMLLLLFSHSFVSDSVTSWTTACQASLSFTISRSLLKLTSIESVMPSNHLILCQPLLLLSSIVPSIRVFSNELVLHIRWPTYLSFSFSTNSSNNYSGLISFKVDLFDLHSVQGTLKSLLQHHSSKASILWCSALHDYWKDYSFDYMVFWWQSDVFAF